MHPYIGDQPLDAEYSIERDGDHLALILASASGRNAGRPGRNTEYKQALALLITRLRERDAVLLDALVDSSRTRHLPEEERRLIRGPIRLSDHSDSEGLRRRLTTAQVRIGQSPTATKGGNSTKRIRLRISLPGYALHEADRLARDLAALPSTTATDDGPPSDPHPPHDAMGRVSASEVTIETMLTAVEQLRPQRYVDGFAKRHQPLTLLWAIGRARNGKNRLAPWPEAEMEIGRLIDEFGHPGDARNPHLPFLALNGTALWELSAPPPPKGLAGDAHLRWLNTTRPHVHGGLQQPVHNLFATSTEAVARVADSLLLTYFDGTDEAALLHAVGLDEATSTIEAHRRRFLTSHLTDGPASEPAAGAFQGTLSKSSLVEQRGEQATLRRLLLRGRGAACALCEAQLPERFLVAAHIKKRSHCTEEERRSLDNIAMLACTLGCDSLYEHGYIAVSEDGTIMLSKALDQYPALGEHVRQRLLGRKTQKWNIEREPYFAWHRTQVYLG
ncbi:hypothetical protein ABT352_15855 [Streptosporangium sp. NPDC000563]|uniref:hypothetical protein n=1 Tax=Streptosporangium sp. NPDC000563 TaxID=3154366 RepID=UPI003330CAF7